MARKYILNEHSESHWLSSFLVFYVWYYMHPLANLVSYQDNHLAIHGISFAPPPTVGQQIIANGCPFEAHIALTADGYLLDMERIPNDGPPVLLLHGLADSSATWVMDRDPDDTLAHHLHDAGFDVWLGNTRGTQLSEQPHVSLSSTSTEFWDFNLDHMIAYDFPALVKCVLNHSLYSSLGVVGHSQGAMIALTALSGDESLQIQINSLITLSAAADFSHSDLVNLPGLEYAPPLLSLCEYAPGFPLCGLFQPANIIRTSLFLPVCRRFPWFCDECLCEIAGCLSADNYDGDMFQYYPVESSAQVLHHFAQMNIAGSLQRFDHGYDGNMRAYQSPEPPVYSLSAKVPTLMMYGMADKLVTYDRSRQLASKLQGDNLKAVHEFEAYGHGDLIWGRDKRHTVLPKVSAHLRMYAHNASVADRGGR